MKLTIFAATGGIGRHVLEQAVDAGSYGTQRIVSNVGAVRSAVALRNPETIKHAIGIVN